MINMSINSAYVPQFTRAHGVPEQREFVRKADLVPRRRRASFGFMVLSGTLIRVHSAARESARLSPSSASSSGCYFIYVNASSREAD
jgi:hypothetical protein